MRIKNPAVFLINEANSLRRSISHSVRAIPESFKIASKPSYFPEHKRKSFIHRCFDNLVWAIRYHEANKFYNAYGLDLCGTSQNGYLDNELLNSKRRQLNHHGEACCQTVLLDDKFLFYKYANANQLPVPEVFGLYMNHTLYNSNFEKCTVLNSDNVKDFFLKPIDGCQGSLIKHIENKNEFLATAGTLQQKCFILQQRVRQHKEMNRLNSRAVNTLRIITVNTGKTAPFVLSSVLRIGTKVSGNVDNWHAGGLSIGIEPDGSLKKYGFFYPKFGTKVACHPDTGLEFSGFKIPFYKEALALACHAHNFFYNIFTIGWDIVITDEGPAILEGNHNFDIGLNQMCDHPLKDDWIKACNIVR